MSDVPSLLISIPVLGRPHRAQPVSESARAATPDARILFLCSPGDREELRAVRATGEEHVIVPWSPKGRGDFARKQNYAAANMTEDFILLAADDLTFEPGWFEEALRVHRETGCLVIGTQDLANGNVIRGTHATHSLVHRDYIALGTADQPGVLLHEGYDHNSVDCELVETAQARGQFAHAARSVVAHHHPTFDRTIPRDATYRKGLRFAGRDKRLFLSRRRLWADGL